MNSQKSEDKNSGFEVFFGLRTGFDSASLPSKSVFIAPTGRMWNDFGHRTNCHFLVALSEGDHFEFQAYIGFLSEKPNDAERLSMLIEQQQGMLRAPSGLQFFTMLGDMEAYRSLVGSVGQKEAVQLLLAVNDLVAYSEFKPSERWLDRATKSTPFLFSFVRQASSYFAFKNAGPILRGLEFEELGRLSQSLNLKFQLPGVVNEHDLIFRFDHKSHLPKRISVVIGKNGVGKSQCLSRVARAVLNGTRELTDADTGGRPLINRLLAFAPTNEAESVFPSERRKNPRVWYRRFSLNRSRRAKRNEYIPDLIIQLARSEQRIAKLSRWEIFLAALGALQRPDELVLPVDSSYRRFARIHDLLYGGEQSWLETFAQIDLRSEPLRLIDGVGYPLSSGEISFLKFAAQVSLHIENGSLLLLDEPETHLHPNFISQFIALLDRLLESTGSAAILSTHSAYFVREVFREQVTVLSIEDGWVTSQHPRLRTFGGDVGAISFFVFGEEFLSLHAEKVRKQLLARNGSWEALFAELKEEVSAEFLIGLRQKKLGKRR
jgi:ABC-type branched-subunit amino acid transport system ATPase component